MLLNPRAALILSAAIAVSGLAACGKKAEDLSPNAAAVFATGAVQTQASGAMAASAPAPASAVGAASKVAANSSSAHPSARSAEAQADLGTTASAVQQVSSAALSAKPKGRQLVRNAALNFTVKDVYQASLAIEDALAAHDGYVVNSSVNRQVLQQTQFPDDAGMVRKLALVQTVGDLHLRLPAAKASAFVRSIANQMEVLHARTLTANDVQFDLLRQQLEAVRAQATAEDLSQLAQQAGRIADKNQTIAQRRQAAIEANEAHLAKLTLADQVDFATVTLHIVQTPFVHKTTEVDFQAAQRDFKPNFASRMGFALADGWNGFLDALLGLVSMWPFALFVITLAVLVLRSGSAWQKLRGVFARKSRRDDAAV